MYVEFETVLEDSEGNEFEICVGAAVSNDRKYVTLESIMTVHKNGRYTEFSEERYATLTKKEYDFLEQEALDKSREY